MIEIKSQKIDEQILENQLNKIMKKYDHIDKKVRRSPLNDNEMQTVSEDHSQGDKRYTIRDIVDNYHNEEFVRKVYKIILKREATTEEINYYMNLLQNGIKSKTEILVYIRFSKEGKEKKVDIKNIRLYYYLIRSFSIPFIGGIFRWFFAIISLPKLLKRYNILESRLMLETVMLQGEIKFLRETLLKKTLEENKDKSRNDLFYIDFEDKFRGSRETIKKRQLYYVPKVKSITDKLYAPVLDIGCGRGEWLEVLKEYDIDAKGIDLNTLMIKEAMQYQLNVENTDALQYLKKMATESLSVISAFHIVEHLPLEILIEILDEVYRVLKQGGMIILETPNPENILVGSCSFYTDPTHNNPIPPATLKFFVEHRGFQSVELHGLHPVENIKINNPKDMDGLDEVISFFNKEQDYAVIGYKL